MPKPVKRRIPTLKLDRLKGKPVTGKKRGYGSPSSQRAKEQRRIAALKKKRVKK